MNGLVTFAFHVGEAVGAGLLGVLVVYVIARVASAGVLRSIRDSRKKGR